MGNRINSEEKFNILDIEDLKKFIRDFNKIDRFFIDTNLAVSSKCLVVLNNLISFYDEHTHRENNSFNCEIFPDTTIELDGQILSYLEQLKANFRLMRHLTIYNSQSSQIDEFIRLGNFSQLNSLYLENIPIKFLHHLKFHRESLIKMSVHGNMRNVKDLIEGCGGDESFIGAWINLSYLDLRFNNLKVIDNSVKLLTNLSVLDVSRNDLDDISFISDIPTLICLNASFNRIKFIPNLKSHRIKSLLLAYNNLDGVDGIQSYKNLERINVSFNIITSNDYLQQLKELDKLEDVTLKGNPLSYSKKYRYELLDFISFKVPDNFSIDGRRLSRKEEKYLRLANPIKIAPPTSQPIRSVQSVSPSRHSCSPPVLMSPHIDEHGDEEVAVNFKRNIQVGHIDSQSQFPSRYEISANYNLNQQSEKSTSKKMFREPRMISSSLYETEYDSGMTTDKSVPSGYNFGDFQLYYVGPKSTSAMVTHHAPYESYNLNYDRDSETMTTTTNYKSVSLQLIKDKFMLVDDRDVVVHSSQLQLLLLFQLNEEDGSKGSITEFINDIGDNAEVNNNRFDMYFVENQRKFGSDTNELLLLRYRFTCQSVYEVQELKSQLRPYLSSFKIIIDLPNHNTQTDFPLCHIILKCNQCQFPLSVNTQHPTNHVFRCLLCEKSIFTLHKINNLVLQKQQASSIQVIPNAIMVPSPTNQQSAPTMQSTLLLLQQQNYDDSKSKSTENVFNDTISKHDSTMKTINTTDESFLTVSEGDKSDCATTEFFSPSDDRGLDEDEFNSSNDFTPSLENQVPTNVGEHIFSKAMFIQALLSCENDVDVLNWLKTKSRNDAWILDEPLSNVKFYMHSEERKIDDRIKVYFLARVMKNDEDIVAAYKVFVMHRFPSKTAVETLFVVSDRRILLYEWTDKEAPDFEDCLKFMCEYKLKDLTKLEYVLNTQWLDIEFNNKSNIFVFVGDKVACTLIGRAISDSASLNASRFKVKPRKFINALDGYPGILSQLTEACPNLTEENLQSAEVYMLKSNSLGLTLTSSDLDYVPRFMLIENENIFFIKLSFPSKTTIQPQLTLESSISMFSLASKLRIDANNKGVCQLLITENNTETSILLEFMSTHSRTQAILRLCDLYKALYQLDINLEITSAANL